MQSATPPISIILFDPAHSGRQLVKDIASYGGFTVVSQVQNIPSLISAEDINPRAIVCMYMPEGTNPPDGMSSYIRKTKLKSIVVCHSASLGFEMLRLGVNEMIVYSDSGFFTKSLSLRCKIMLREAAENRSLKLENRKPLEYVVAMGASTGGTESVVNILRRFPADMPPILLTQHMPPVFTNLFAKRLNGLCKMTVWEASDGDVLQNGLMLVAPGDRQMYLERHEDNLVVRCLGSEKVGGHCPSVDVLFSSVAQIQGIKSLGCILTGMGADGAKGLLKMRNAGAHTVGQDQASSVVYGMPKAAWEINAVQTQLPLDNIAEHILSLVYYKTKQ